MKKTGLRKTLSKSPIRNPEGKSVRWKPKVWASKGRNQRNKKRKLLLASDPGYGWFDFAREMSGLSRNAFTELIESPGFDPVQPPPRMPRATISMSLRLSCFPVEQDPLIKTLSLSQRHFKLKPGQLLKKLWFQLLAENKLNDLVGARPNTVNERIRKIKNWPPYGWTVGRPFAEKKQIKPGEFISYSFLGKGPYTDKKKQVAIRFSEKNDEFALTKVLLPWICQRFVCNIPDFFKLLYVSFLRKHGVVDELGGLLDEEWKNRFLAIDPMSIEVSSEK